MSSEPSLTKNRTPRSPRSLWSRILPLLSERSDRTDRADRTDRSERSERSERSTTSPRAKSKYGGIHVASPKYNEFASKYLDSDGKIREDVTKVILSRPHVKEIAISYDYDNRRWGFVLRVTDEEMVNVVANDRELAKYPCRITV